METQDVFYLKVRVAVNRQLTDEEIREVSENLDLTVLSGNDGVRIVNSTIEETTKDYEMTKTV